MLAVIMAVFLFKFEMMTHSVTFLSFQFLIHLLSRRFEYQVMSIKPSEPHVDSSTSRPRCALCDAGCTIAPSRLPSEWAPLSFSPLLRVQADEYAVKQGKGKDLMAGLIKISKDNKSNANPDPLYSAYHHTHPALIERLDAISKSIKAKAD
jgi:hypothetical protein